MHFRSFTVALVTGLALLPAGLAAAEPAPLSVVGVLGNTSGLGNRPVPYAYYTGIGADARGRIYLSGAAEGIPVCDQDGLCLAVLPLPDPEGMTAQSLMVRAGDALFVVARKHAQSALYRIDTAPQNAAELKATRVLTGRGHWALAPQLDAQGRVLLGQSEVDKLRYSVVAVEPGTGANAVLFTLDMPKGAMPPWQHIIQVEADGSVSIQHAGGVNWNGRYTVDGRKAGDAPAGILTDGYRFRFGYGGGLQRFVADGSTPAPGECGSPAPEIRMPYQLCRVNDRCFFAGRGGAVEASWNGQNFVFERRIGALYVEDMVDAGVALHAIAYTGGGNQDVQHYLNLPKAQPIGERLDVLDPEHSRTLYALVKAPEGCVALARDNKRTVHVLYGGRARHLDFDVALPEVKEIGQAAVQGKDLLFADSATGTLWRRPLLAREGTVTAWGTNVPGVTALAVSSEAVFVATATQVSRLKADGSAVEWTAPVTYKGVRRLAVAGEFVYVCDAAGHVVDQLSAATGELKARLGVPGQPGSALDRLNKPWAIAADLNGVYVADNGNGRVLVATTTLWRPEIPRLPREDRSPLVAAKVPVTAPAGQRLSVNIYDENDLTVRQLACAQPSDQPVLWDGRDMYGQWAKPGRYRYHGILAPKLSLRYVTSIGQSGNPPYRTEDGKGSWGGVWGNVMDVCMVTAEPASDIVVLWAFEEGEGGLIRMSQDGEVRWKQHLDWWMKAMQMAVASDGTFVYITGASAMNAPEGQTNYQGAWNRPLLWRVDAATGAKKLYSSDQAAQPMFGEYKKKEGRIVTDLAVRDGKLYLTAPAQDTLFVIAADSAKQLAAWPVKDVSGVTFDQTGRLLAGSGDTIVELDPADGKVRRTVVAKAGGPIWSLATTPAMAGAESAGKKPADDGFFATIGEPRHQVVYFNAKGKEKRALGVKGGRPLCGKMQPESFREPVGFCVAGNGRLFVAENATPRRFTRWSAAGKLEREFHGPYYYSGMFGIDEDEPELVYGDTHSDLIRYRVDYQTGAWKVEHYWIKAYEQAGVPIKWWPRIRHHDGKVWWCSGSGAIAELQEDKVRGVAAGFGGWVEKKEDGSFAPAYHNKKTGFKGTWSDLNGDGRQQPEEWQVTDQPTYSLKAGGPQQGWGCYFDENFNLYMHDWSDQEPGGVWKLPVTAWTNGVPVYRWDQAQYAGRVRTGPGLAHGSPGARTAFAYNGAVFAFNGGYNAAGLPGVGHGHDWEFAQITKYDEATGRPLWHAGERCAAFLAPGQHYCPTGAAGVIGDCLFWTDENSLIHVWDIQHGLYVDTLLEDGSRGPVPSPYTVWVELFNSRVFKHPRTGKVYLLAASDAIHVFEVLGAEQSITRLQGEFELTADGLRSAQQRVAAATAPKVRTMTIRRAAGPVTVDGDLAEFAKAESAKLELRPGARGTIRLMADDANLCLGADVEDDSPWQNAGGDVTALFKTGDEVSLWLGPSAAKRAAGEGDLRILFAPDGRSGVTVVLYRAKVKDGAKPVSFRSPSGEVRLDKVEVVTTVPAAVKVTDGGYRLEAAVPWNLTGLNPAAAGFGLDVSINFSDPAGQRNVARLHWGRNGAGMVYDLPSEARLEPETWGVGEVENVQRSNAIRGNQSSVISNQ